MGKSKLLKNNEPGASTNIVLRYPKGDTFGLGVFLLSVATIMALIVLPTKDAEAIFAGLIAICFLFLLGVSYICLYYNWEIKIINDRIYYRNLLRQTKCFEIVEIEYVTIRRHKAIYEMYVYSKGRKLFSLYTFCFGHKGFLHLLQSWKIPIRR